MPQKNTIRTDLAVEAKQLWEECAEETTKLEGVKAEDYKREGLSVTKVEILNEKGAEELGKPVGTYVTVELSGLGRGGEDAFRSAVEAVSSEIRSLLGISESAVALVIGLGNWHITPDAIGPKTVENTMVTKHLCDRMPEMFGRFRPVSALSPGVLGQTGLESAQVIKGVRDELLPDCVIVIDALASRNLSRLCSTVQITDTGIIPGSGIGNARAAINRETLGVPVVAVGVPTVVDVATLASDLIEQSGGGEVSPEVFSRFSGGMIVTPKEIDEKVTDISKILGYSINLALHQGISVEDVTSFLS